MRITPQKSRISRIGWLRSLIAMLAVSVAGPLCADDLFVIDGHAVGGILPGTICSQLAWDIDNVFFNFGTSDASIKLIGVSNGDILPQAPRAFTVPAHGSASIRAMLQSSWTPADAPILWVYHLSTSTSVNVDSELFPSATNVLCPGVGVTLHSYGKVRLPVFRSLLPAGQRQFLTGLSLGDVDARINVAVYNAGPVEGLAIIEIHRACDQALMETRIVAIPPNAIVQFGGFHGVQSPSECATGSGLNGIDRLTYVVVTVDEPSLSFASIVANGQVPVSNIQVSTGTTD